MFDDDIMDDEFGASDRRIARLIKRKAKLQAMLQVAGPAKQRRILKRLARIDKVLARTGYAQEAAAAQLATAAAGVEGVGGLMFQAQSPPGLGRLLRLPFYPNTAHTGTITAGGQNAASSTNPTMIESAALVNAANSSNTQHTLQTPQVSWATLRIVGFEATSSSFKGIGNTGPSMLVSDLQIGGGANLFTHEDFADAFIYDANQPEFCGLRDYPILKSPNQASVTALHVGDQVGETITWSCALLCEVLVDDNYGAHVPGSLRPQGCPRPPGRLLRVVGPDLGARAPLWRRRRPGRAHPASPPSHSTENPMPRKQANPYLQSQAAVHKAMVDGVGGMQFTAQSPPGVGRLIRIPFYLSSAVVGFAAAVENTTDVAITASIAAGTGTSTSIPTTYVDFARRDRHWWRHWHRDPADPPRSPGPPCGSSASRVWCRSPRWPRPPSAPCRSATSRSAVARTSSSTKTSLPRASTSLVKTASQASATTPSSRARTSPRFRPRVSASRPSARLAFSASLVCEILVDDNYGAHVPGAYARAGALVRQGWLLRLSSPGWSARDRW